MANKALSKMSLSELKAQRREIDAAIAGYKDRQIAEAKKAIEAVAKDHGVSVKDIYGTGSKRKKAKAAPKYRNPANPDETWSGKGRQPAWYKAAIAAGASLESMKIQLD